MSEPNFEPDMVPVCRSIMVDGRRTSIRMEREFWTGLDNIRRQERMTMQDILEQAIGEEADANRTAAIKAWVLAYYRQGGFGNQNTVH